MACIFDDLLKSCMHKSNLTTLFLLENCTEDLNRMFPFQYCYNQHSVNSSRSSNRDYDEGTVFHQAVIRGYSEVVESLLQKGVDVNIKTKMGRSALDLIFFSTESWGTDRILIVQILLHYDVIIDTLHIARCLFEDRFNWKGILKSMIKSATESELRFTVQTTIFDYLAIPHCDDFLSLVFLAAYKHDMVTIRNLVKKDSQFLDTIKNGMTETHNLDIVDVVFLNVKHNINTPFTIELFSFLKELEFKFDLNKISGNRWPILHRVLRDCIYNYEVVKILLQYGADPNLSFENKIPLACTDNGSVKRLLLEHGADPNFESRTTLSPMFATDGENEAILFLEHGADPNTSDYKGKSFLHHHFMKANKRVVTAVLKDWLPKK